jgi:hypothetical protein
MNKPRAITQLATGSRPSPTRIPRSSTHGPREVLVEPKGFSFMSDRSTREAVTEICAARGLRIGEVMRAIVAEERIRLHHRKVQGQQHRSEA